MKNFLQNLLIFFALALCALIAFQWVRETDLRKRVQGLTDTIHDKMESIQNLEASVRRDEAEIQRLDGIKKDLSLTIKSNTVQITGLSRDLDRATNLLAQAKAQIDIYKDALQKANDSILKQNEEIKKQNEDMKKLAEDRNEVVKKFNTMAKDYNDLATKWNKQQEELAMAATNKPAAKK
jgi:chromosome segregation ATPase